MNYNKYVKHLKRYGYRVENNLVFLKTPYGNWIQQIEESNDGFCLVSLFNPQSKLEGFKLTEYGRKAVEGYISELVAKRKEILDAGKDTANDTKLPEVEDIETDLFFTSIDDSGEYYNGWPVTDNYDADLPILLKIGRDFKAITA